jgi:4-amino-4-deoxy-L-arabinose transferase-like glycosyltransferase
MSQSPNHPPIPYAPWAARLRATIVLALGVLAARVAYLWWGCPYTLVEDEAFYWTWTQRPELSYYSKGPGVAWLLGASTHLLGDTMAALRLPSAVAASITAIVLAAFTNDVLGPAERRAGFFAACCFLLSPLFQVSSLVGTVDAPYTLFWILACWAAWRALGKGTDQVLGPGQVVLALFIGLGFLVKYTSLLLIPGLAVFAWWKYRRGARTLGRSRLAVWLVLGAIVLGAGLAPVVIWNAKNHWPTTGHLLGHLGLPGGDVTPQEPGWRYSPVWMLEFVGTQLAGVGPALALAWIGVARSRREWASDPNRRTRDLFLLCCGLPTIVFYLGVTFVSRVEANWAMAGYVPLMALAGGAIAAGMDAWKREVAAWRARPAERRVRAGLFRRQPETLVQFFWNATVVVGVVMALGSLRLDALGDVIERLKKTPVVSWVVPDRLSIPVGRFTGADKMGQHAGELLARLSQRRPREPFVLTQHYGRAAHLEFYMPGRPIVYCASAFVFGGRRSQYDYWRQTDLRGAMRLLGRDALIVGGYSVETWLPFFERVELLGTLDGDGKRDRPAYYGYGFRGVEAAMVRLKATPQGPDAPLPVYPTAPRAIPLDSPAKESP